MIKKYAIAAIVLATVSAAAGISTAAAETIATSLPTSATGALKLNYSQVQVSDYYLGRSQTVEVSSYPNAGTPVIKLIDNSAEQWHVQPGQTAAKGQAVLSLSGPEVEHTLTEYELAEAQLEIIESRYRDNEKLYRAKAISAAQWQEVSSAYQSAKLAYEYMQHFFDEVSAISSDRHTITLSAPIAGVVQQDPNASFRIVPSSEVRLKGLLKHAQALPQQVETSTCRLDIARIDASSQGFNRYWYSSAIPAQCQLSWGQFTSATPAYSKDVYSVPKQAVIRHEGSQYVFVYQRANEQLVLTPITIVGSASQDFFVSSSELRASDQVLESSVGAVYGILLGFGGE